MKPKIHIGDQNSNYVYVTTCWMLHKGYDCHIGINHFCWLLDRKVHLGVRFGTKTEL